MTRAGGAGQGGAPIGLSADRQPSLYLELSILSEIHHGTRFNREYSLFLYDRFAGEKPRSGSGG